MVSEQTGFSEPGQNSGVQSAGQVRIVGSVRSMRTYGVTDSELRSIALTNGLASLFFSFATGLWGYAFSMSTDLVFMDKPTIAAIQWNEAIHPICIRVGIAFAVCGFAMLVWRHFAIELIKRESSGDIATPSKNRFLRAWKSIWYGQ